MALEFTSIPDRDGPAIYILTSGSSQLEDQLTKFGEEVDALTPDETQVCLLDPNSGDGLSIKEFYSLTTFPVIMIVMDDDTIYHLWTEDVPQPSEVSYYLSQVNGSMA